MTQQKQTDSEALKQILITSGVVAGGGALSASVLNYLKKRRDDNKRRKLTDAMVQSDMPIVRIDPAINDTEFEEKLDQSGLDAQNQLQKVSQQTPPPAGPPPAPPPTKTTALIVAPTVGLGMIGGTMLDQFVQALPSFARKPIEWLSDPEKPSWAAPAAVAASLASAYGGYRGMDWLMNKIDRDDIDYSIRRKKNLMQLKVNQLLRQKYGDAQKVAFICSEAANESGVPFEGLALTRSEYANVEASVDKYLEMEKQAEVAVQSPSTQSTINDNVDMDPSYKRGQREATALYVLLATGLTGLSYSLSKGYFDKQSDRRKRLKELERDIRKRAIASDSPMLIDADFDLGDHKGALTPGENVPVTKAGHGLAAAGVEPVVDAVKPGVIAGSVHSPTALPEPAETVPNPVSMKAKSILD